ncbi:hypothetical protein ACVWW5_000219 [Bradyrhizobium sp. LM3.4]
MDQACPRGRGRLGDGLGALGLDGIKTLRAAFGEDADQIDHDMRITQRRLDRGRIAQVGLHGVNLPDFTGGLEVPGQLRPPHRDPDPVVAPAQRADDIPAQKPRSAENRDESFQIRCHGGPFLQEECVLSGLYRAGLRCAIRIRKRGSSMN